MTPKEQAIELYEKFYYATDSILAAKKQDLTAKRNALICVDEMIKIIENFGGSGYMQTKFQVKHLGWVKDEIAKI